MVSAGAAEQNGADAEEVRVVVPAALVQQQHEPVGHSEEDAAPAEAEAQHHTHSACGTRITISNQWGMWWHSPYTVHQLYLCAGVTLFALELPCLPYFP